MIQQEMFNKVNEVKPSEQDYFMCKTGKGYLIPLAKLFSFYKYCINHNVGEENLSYIDSAIQEVTQVSPRVYLEERNYD